ncbi:MAG: ribosome biogenesis GTPase Der [Candidatus Hydrogenedentes bacterium]|nr:ribosome biogenesis GTPase Der [Candidatus Hydrogenedentota bacterium]
MSRKKKAPLVAICGRPNVGKSTLFNRMIGKSRAIVHDLEGITRDRFYGEAEWEGHKFRVVDTGGIIENPVDPISEKMQQQVRAALDEARVIVFVVDGQQPITRTDEQVRDALFRQGKPVVLAVNKLDNPAMESQKYDFFALGLGEPYPISSGHGLGIAELMDAVVSHLPAPGEAEPAAEPERVVTKVAVVGKPNVGKSSFINAILNEERTIVHDEPGTTRDAIDIDFRWKEKEYLLIDTAGLRKKAGIRQPVEHFSVSRSLRAMRRADVCLVMMDATEGISEQDKRIIGYALENGIAMVLVWTKWDLVGDKERRFKALADELDLKMPQVRYVPSLTMSNVTRQRLFAAFEYIDRVAEAAEKRVSTAELNKLIEEVKEKHNPPSIKGKHAKILYATQVGVKPTTFVLFVNQKRLFHFSYLRFVENQIRERFGFEGVPIKLELREGKPST